MRRALWASRLAGATAGAEPRRWSDPANAAAVNANTVTHAQAINR